MSFAALSRCPARRQATISVSSHSSRCAWLPPIRTSAGIREFSRMRIAVSSSPSAKARMPRQSSMADGPAVVEYAAETAGTVLQLLVAEGDQVDVGAPIAIIGEPGETVGSADAAPAAPAESPGSPPESDPESAAPVADAEPVYELPQEAVTTTHAAAEAAPSVAPASGRRFVSPLVRRLARERGLSLDSVTGTGPGGRIVRKDLERLEQAGPGASGPAPAPAAPAAPAPATATPPAGTPGARAAGEEPELVPHSRMRKTIARRLTESKNEAPQLHPADCRVDRLLDLRRELNATGTVKVSVNDLVVKAVAGAFVDVPEANRTWTDEGMLQHRSVDIAIAVSLDDGLVTPVVRGVEGLSVSALGGGSSTSPSAPGRVACASTRSRAAASPCRTSACSARRNSARSSTRRRPASSPSARRGRRRSSSTARSRSARS